MDQTKSMLSSESRNLSNREWRVIELLGAGLHNRDISEHMGIREQSVKELLRKVYHKMGMDRLNLALWYVKYQCERNVQ